MSRRLRLRLGRRSNSGPPPASYPQGILNLDTLAGNNVMKGVWDLRTTAGPNQSYTSSYAVNGAPAGGWAVDPGDLLYPPASANWTLDRWDLQGAQVLGKGGSTLATFTNCRFNRPGSSMELSTSEASIGNYQFTRCFFDGDSMIYETPGSGERAGMVNMSAGTYTVNFNDCKFDKAPLNSLRGTPTTVNMTDTFVGTCCTDPKSDSHMESLFIESGTWTLTRCLLDVKGSVPDKGGITGIVYFEAGKTTVNATLTNVVVRKGDWDNLYTMQATARADQGFGPQNLTINFVNCAIESSSSSYIAQNQQSGCVLTINATGCVDLYTGANIDSQLQYP